MRFFLPIFLMTGLAPLASAQTVDATDPQALLQIIRSEGFRAELDRDSVGDPRISSASQGVSWNLWFYGCSDGNNCTSVQFQAGFDKSEPMDPSTVNEWNSDTRFCEAFLDEEGDPYLVMDVNMEGGVARENFADTVEIWDDILGDFVRYIDW